MASHLSCFVFIGDLWSEDVMSCKDYKIDLAKGIAKLFLIYVLIAAGGVTLVEVL